MALLWGVCAGTFTKQNSPEVLSPSQGKSDFFKCIFKMCIIFRTVLLAKLNLCKATRAICLNCYIKHDTLVSYFDLIYDVIVSWNFDVRHAGCKYKLYYAFELYSLFHLVFS